MFLSRNFGAQSGGKFSLYRAVLASFGARKTGPWGFSLTSLMDDPALISRKTFFDFHGVSFRVSNYGFVI